jgi:hypothetical protein
MWYEINVSLNGKHLFATDKRSLSSSTEAENLYIIFEQKFPASEGYRITVTKWEMTGNTIKM